MISAKLATVCLPVWLAECGKEGRIGVGLVVEWEGGRDDRCEGKE